MSRLTVHLTSRTRPVVVVGAALLQLIVVGGCSDSDSPTRPWSYLIQYEFVETWGDSGSGNGQFHYPQGVTVDASGNVYVIDTVNRRIQKFTSSGTYLTQWGTAGSGDGQFGYMNSAAIDASGNVYVADAGNSRIQKFTSDGVYLLQWGTLGNGNGQFSEYGMVVAVDPGGNVYVADVANGRIQKFASDGTYLTQFGAPGSGDGRFTWPRGLAVDGNGYVYVADGHHSIQKFTNAGTFIARWPMRGENISGAERLAVNSSGFVFVTDWYSRRVRLFTSAGRFVADWEVGDERWEWGPDLALDRSGRLYVTDTQNNRLLKYAP